MVYNKMWCLLAVALIASASATSSNVNVVANVDYLNTLAQAVLPTVEGLINDLKLGNYTFDVKYSFLTANIEVDNVELVDTTSSAAYFTLAEPNLLTLKLENVSTLVKFYYVFKSGFLNYKGNGSLAVSETNFVTTVHIESANSKPQVFFQDTAVKIGKFVLQTELSSTLQNILVQALTAEIGTIEQTVASTVNTLSDTVNPLLAGINFAFAIPDTPVVIDAGLTDSTVATDSLYGTAFLNGTVYDQTNPQTYAGHKVELPTVSSLNGPLQALVSEWAVNNFLLNFYTYADFTIDEIPAQYGVSLTTTTLATFLPELRTVYGDNVPLALRFYGTKDKAAPEVHINNGVNGRLAFNNDILVSNASGFSRALTLAWGLSFDVSGTLTDFTVNATINSITLDGLEVVDTQMGAIDIESSKTFLSNLYKAFLPAVNQQLAALTIPAIDIPYVTILSAGAKSGVGYLEAVAEVAWKGVP